MNKPRVGILTFAEQREEFYIKRKPILEEESKKIMSSLSEELDCILSDPIQTKDDLIAATDKIKRHDVSSIILSLPIWSSPNIPALAVKILDKPVLLLGNMRADSSSTVAILAAGGALDQMGYSHRRIMGQMECSETMEKVIDFCIAAQAKNQLKGAVFGLFGGRGLSICTTTADPAQWQSIFGIDIEHIDQMEIMRISNVVIDKELDKYKQWLKNNLGKIEFNKNSFTEDKLELQIRSYIAAKKIISAMGLDFVGIKCQPELSDHFVLQCLNQMMLNDPYDADGPKEPVVSSCEADLDGALTMQMLKIISGLKPAMLLDVRSVGEREMILANCGAMSSWYTNYSNDPSENLKDVHLVPHVFGKAGGGAVQLIAGDGEATLARLCRKNGKYWMAILKGSVVKKPRKELKKTTWSFPHVFIDLDYDRNGFLKSFGSNHIHLGAGNLVNRLSEFCRLLSIEYKIYSN